jgi:hypothetical protein
MVGTKLFTVDLSNLFHTGKHYRSTLERMCRAAHSEDRVELKWAINLLYFGNTGLISQFIQRLPIGATLVHLLVEQRAPM